MLVEFGYSAAKAGVRKFGFIDLAFLARAIHDRAGDLPPSYVPGKAAIRGAVVEYLGCSPADAEQLVDEMERVGFVQFVRPRRGRLFARPQWRFSPRAPVPVGE